MFRPGGGLLIPFRLRDHQPGPATATTTMELLIRIMRNGATSASKASGVTALSEPRVCSPTELRSRGEQQTLERKLFDLSLVDIDFAYAVSVHILRLECIRGVKDRSRGTPRQSSLLGSVHVRINCMQTRGLFWFLLAFTVLGQAESPESLRVMTFNVRNPNPDDGVNIWENRKDILVDTIRKYDPDVFGTQELFDLQGRYIVEKLPEYEWFGLTRWGNHENEHMGVFYKRAKLFVMESGNFWLSETPDEPGSMSWDVSLPRLVTWARFRDADGEEFYFYNTHFPHRREDAAARLNCAKVIVEDLRRRVPAFANLILLGDFNSAADSDVHALLTTELTDAQTVAPKTSGPATTSSRWIGQTEGRRIDWILYRGDWKVSEVETIDFNRGGRYPSDHYPVFAVFEPGGRSN